MAPNGVMFFADKESFNKVMSKIIAGNFQRAQYMPSGFRTLSDFFEDHRQKKEVTLDKKFTGFSDGKFRSTSVSSHISTDAIEDGTYQDYIYSHYINLVPDHYLPQVLNENLQIMIGDAFYQITPVGTFEVQDNSMSSFTSWYFDNSNNIWNTSNFTIPNEISLGDGLFQVDIGVQRLQINIPSVIETNTINPLPPVVLFPPSTGSNSSGPDIPMQLVVADSRGEGRGLVGMPGNRRFNFNSFNNRYAFWNAIGIQGRVQRLRKLLWMSYWGESFGDEIIIGADNLDLETEYVIPSPEVMAANQMAFPKFKGFKKLKLGSHVADFVEFAIGQNGIPILGQHLTQTVATNFMNGIINSPHATNIVNDYMKQVVPGLINEYVDPSYRERYMGEPMYITSLKTIQNNNKLRFTAAQVYIKEGYSNRNNWTFDWNIMLSLDGEIAYGYKMKSGNFIGKARVGSAWAGIRIVKYK